MRARLIVGSLYWFRLCLLTALAIAPLRTEAQGHPLPEMNPYTVSSLSGEYTLRIDPSSRYAIGEASYRLERKGKTVWEGKRPFTLYEAGVTNDGTVGGYAYSGGLEGLSLAGPLYTGKGGDFEVVILTPSGQTRLLEKTERDVHSGPEFHYAYPEARRLIFDTTQDRMIVAVREKQGGEMWRFYRLSTGEIEPPRTPPPYTPGNNRMIVATRAVVGTPLLLVQWTTGGDKLGARFALLDLQYRSVWQLDLPDDYVDPLTSDTSKQLMEEIRRGSAVLRADEPGRFTLRFVKENQRVTFTVEPLEEGQWRVTPIRRETYTPPQPRKVTFDAPLISLRLRGRITLPPTAGEAQKAPQSDPPAPIDEVAVRSDGSILQTDLLKGLVHVYDVRGRRKANRPSLTLAALAKRRRAGKEIQSPGIVQGRANTFFLWDEEFDREARSLGKGRDARSPMTRSEKIQRRPDDTWMGRFHTLAMASDGSLALLENDVRSGWVSLYTAQNKPERLIALPWGKYLGETPTYNGKLIVLLDYERLYAYGRDGKPRWQCLLPAGKNALDWTPFLTESGHTLCLFDGRHTLYRYTLP